MCCSENIDNNINSVVNEFKNVFGSNPTVVVSAPGRIDFLNTHQDYKGLPVVGIGINLRTFIAIKPVNGSDIVVGSSNLRSEGFEYIDIFSVDRIEFVNKSRWFGNYIRAAVYVLKKYGYNLNGFKMWINSQVPMGSGLGSSGTLLVSVIGGLNEIFDLGLDAKAIAELAYIAEHDVMGIPCGRLDQYTAAFGGIVYIEMKPPYKVETLSYIDGVFGIVDTGIKHSTIDIHSSRQKEIDRGLSKLLEIVPDDIKFLLGARYWEPQWDKLDISILSHYLDALDETAKNRIIYTIKAHKSTILALKILKHETISIEDLVKAINVSENKAKKLMSKNVLHIIGVIMTYQHQLLSKLYDVSLPEIDRIVDKLIEIGAVGAKLSGAGLGGTVVALFSSRNNAEKIFEENKLGVRKWIVEIDKGFTVHR